MEKVSRSIEHDRLDTRGFRSLRDCLADGSRARGGACVGVAENGAKRRLGGQRGDQRATVVVVDKLRADVPEAAEHRETRTRSRAGHVLAHAAVASRAGGASIVLREHPDQPSTSSCWLLVRTRPVTLSCRPCPTCLLCDATSRRGTGFPFPCTVRAS